MTAPRVPAPAAWAAICAVLLLLFGAAAAAENSWSLADIYGKTHRPFADEKTKAIVLVFITTDCPIANSYQPELARLAKEYGPRGFAVFLIHSSDPELTAEGARKHAEEYAAAAPVVIDAGQQIARRVGAKVAPEAFVIGRGGEMLYRGRIDDIYVDFGKKRTRPTSHDLRAALDDVAAGRKVKTPETEAVGCLIELRE